MHQKAFIHGLTLVGTLALLLAAEPVSAQRAPTGGSAIVSALHPSKQLGSGSLTGAGAQLELGLTPRITLGLASVWYLNAATEPLQEEARVYDLMLPSLNLRASLIGDESDFALLMSAATARYDLAANGGLPAEKLSIPSLGLGAGVRLHLAGPLYLEFEGRDWISYVRNGELGAFRGHTRKLSHTPDVRISLSALFRKKEPVLATFEDLPLSYARDFRPVDATAVIRPPIAETLGRDHVHGDRGRVVPLQDSTQDSVSQAPIQSMTKAISVPGVVYDEYKLGTIYFAIGSHDVKPSYRQLLQDVAQFLNENPDTRLLLQGFADPSGSIQVNLSLAERRGTSVQDLLVRLFDVDPGRVDVVSRGIDYRSEKPDLARRTELIARIPAR